ncbi:MAG TPA: type II toxin-antitoxin system VapC family toxin [Thermomicrobiaceae bacterium]|nr:type II toxin-antitoxin system VapC family toxin [Thermomicrobiaceae bacterium]
MYYAREPQAALAALRRLLAGVLLPLSMTVVERFGILRGALPRQHRNQIGDLDPLIAATALSHDLTLVTRNLRDYRLVPGLALYERETS